MNNDTVQVNREYKDRLFVILFGSQEEKKNIISLYNAINGTEYTEDDDVEITTLKDAIYIKMKNDVSLLIDSHIALWEQQSTINPNMPLRGLMYFGNVLDAYVTKRNINIYGKKLIKIPTPQYIVLYNGAQDAPSIQKQKLSDSFLIPDTNGDFEWTATVYNLNKGKNDNLLAKCDALSDYMSLIHKINENKALGLEVEVAVDKAVKWCIENDIMSEFLKLHRAEVMDVCITEYKEEVFVNGIREEGREEGREKEIFSSVQDGDYSVERGAEKLGISVSDFEERMAKAGYQLPALV